MEKQPVWDVFVRVFHWSLVTGFVLNIWIVDEESDAHIWIGYAILALVLARIIWGFIGTRPARFSAFPPSIPAALRHLGDLMRGVVRPHRSHNPLGALMVYNLLATMLALCVTGWMMTTLRFFGVDWVEELHEALVDWALFSVLLHLGGVLAQSLLERRNLVRPMITGYRLVDRETRD